MKAARTRLEPGLTCRLEQDGGLTIFDANHVVAFAFSPAATWKLADFLWSERGSRETRRRPEVGQ